MRDSPLASDQDSLMQALIVVIASTVTALCTGLGVIPFLFTRDIGNRFLGFGNALAAGLMLGASTGLLIEAVNLSVVRTGSGMVLGFALIFATRLFLKRFGHDDTDLIGEIDSANLKKMILIMTVMTIHSFAEGIGVGVSYGGRAGFGNLISAAIAIHNIPEGLAIGLVMIPRGVSTFHAGLWSVFSSLPQPLMALPAFLFVTAFAPVLPVGLGLAAGAMIYMVIFELVPESLEQESPANVVPVMFASFLAMLGFQFLMS